MTSIYSTDRTIFNAVIKAYKLICAYSPIVAINPDKYARTYSQRLDFDTVIYRADIENAVASAFSGQPDEESLKDAIDNILEDRPNVSLTLADRIITLTVPVFVERELEPYRYLKRQRHPVARAA